MSYMICPHCYIVNLTTFILHMSSFLKNGFVDRVDKLQEQLTCTVRRESQFPRTWYGSHSNCSRGSLKQYYLSNICIIHIKYEYIIGFHYGLL